MRKIRLVVLLLVAELAAFVLGFAADILAPGVVIGMSNQGTGLAASIFAGSALVALGLAFVVVVPGMAVSRERSAAVWTRIVLAAMIAASLLIGLGFSRSFVNASCYSLPSMTLTTAAHIFVLYGLPATALFWLFVGGEHRGPNARAVKARGSLGRRLAILLLIIIVMAGWEVVSWGWLQDRVFC